LIYRDSVELTEVKHPIHMRAVQIHPGTCAPGRFRDAPGAELIYGPKCDPMTVAIPCDGQVFPPKGVNGGHDSPGARTFKIDRDGREERLPGVAQVTLEPGEWLRGIDNSGGGYGNPLERDPERVCYDVAERWEAPERALDIYGVVLQRDASALGYSVDTDATTALRAKLIEPGG
jgi:N-methylhydantoinase B